MEMMLTKDQTEQFNRDGYRVFQRMLTPAACDSMLAITQDHLRNAIAPLEYEADVGYAGAPASLDAPGGKTIRRLRGAYHRHEHFRAWAQDARVGAYLTQLLAEPVCLALAHHNCVMTKHPDFGTATGWHRDIRYWSFTRPDLISVWLALGDERAHNGGLKVIPGSHRLQLQPGQLDELDFLRPDVAANQPLFERGIDIELRQGDVLFFHSGLFHAAGRNASDKIKTSVVFAYRGKSNVPVAGSRSATVEDVELLRGPW